MVGVGDDGKRSVLARVSIVDVHGDAIMDTYVASREKVTDYRTFVSGIRVQNLKGAPQFARVQVAVSKITENKIVVGHALKNDLSALMLTHPRQLIRDTAKYRPYQTPNKKPRKLRDLTAEVLGLKIQGGEHSSLEDARSALLLYKVPPCLTFPAFIEGGIYWHVPPALTVGPNRRCWMLDLPLICPCRDPGSGVSARVNLKSQIYDLVQP
ncbi:ribonuclease H-like domain-containing protein [Baffinella frigidus]|nr:ribonuclease H-like domain-containing protein [Cryptophyta sp. CCMP2293]